MRLSAKASAAVLITLVGLLASRAAATPTEVAICGPEEPGERLIFSGRVLDYRGQPLVKAAVVAYHTDHRGLYNPRNSETRTPRLRGVAVTDADGRFRFSTIQPAPYPDGNIPAHIHVLVAAPAHRERWFEIWFDSDPLVTPARRAEARGGTLIVKPAPGADGVRAFDVDFALEGS